VWFDPGVHWNWQGAAQDVPSTASDNPDGTDVTVTGTNATNVAVTVAGPFMLTFCGVAIPESEPVKPVNPYPLFAAALTETTAPLLYHPLAGMTVPPADGLTTVVKKYCVVKLAV
jgi:hypothetical protein